MERFHGWRALAAEARAMAQDACREVGCDPAQPFVYPVADFYRTDVISRASPTMADCAAVRAEIAAGKTGTHG